MKKYYESPSTETFKYEVESFIMESKTGSGSDLGDPNYADL